MGPGKVVSRNLKAVSGPLVFAGTWVPVEILVQHLTAGYSPDEFLREFASVRQGQAIAYLEMKPEAMDALIAR